jgi:ferritin
MDKKLYELLNQQIKSELYSAYLYLSMASYCDSVNLEGFAKWMKVQAKEEVGHAMKIYEFLNDRNERVILEGIEKPPSDFSSPVDIFSKTLEHEKKVTAMIEKIFEAAKEVGDSASMIFLQWFINEQVEEEKQAGKILEKLKMIEKSPAGLLFIDNELGKRE